MGLDTDRRLARIVRGQHGLLTRSQARAHGITDDRLDHRVRAWWDHRHRPTELVAQVRAAIVARSPRPKPCGSG